MSVYRKAVLPCLGDDESSKRSRCTHCGSTKGHHSNHCLFVCRGCGVIHEAGEYPMEEFYNLICQWDVLMKHAGMLPIDAEKMLN
ncbi:Hypothetical protein PHPALM_14034 [Phytophthora palmivora]|uniref:Uncharacterized protein n=1 Tax=Phytophthora palmivora TaxID=4796 RepID=A0A2P4XVT3_9STRA|nr:Hypothetical protein PHPALM_14034 [Phytophthora palmivora]